MAITHLRDDLFRVCSGSDHTEVVLLAAFPSSLVPVVAAMACIVPILLDPAAALGRISPWHMKLPCLDLVAAFLFGVSSAVCTRQPPSASMLARFRLPDWSSVRSWLLGLRTGSDFAPARLVLFCTGPPLCVGALWPTSAWVWCDVGSGFFFFHACQHLHVKLGH